MIRRKNSRELGREGCEALLRKPAFDEVELGEKARARIKESFGEELSAVQVVQRIVDDVRCRKNEALCDYTQRFDGAQLTADTLEVTAAEWSRLRTLTIVFLSLRTRRMICIFPSRRCWEDFSATLNMTSAP